MQRQNLPPLINTLEYETLVEVRGVTAIINLGSVQPNFPALPQLPVSPVEAARFLALNFTRASIAETPALYQTFLQGQWPPGMQHPRGMASASVISPGPNLQLILPQDPANDAVSYWRPSEAQYGAAQFAEGLRIQADHLVRDQRGVLVARELLYNHYVQYTASLRDGADARPDLMSGDTSGDRTATGGAGRSHQPPSRCVSPSGVSIKRVPPQAAHQQPEGLLRGAAAPTTDGSLHAPSDHRRSLQQPPQSNGGQQQPSCPPEARDTRLIIADNDDNDTTGRPAPGPGSGQLDDRGTVRDGNGPPPHQACKSLHRCRPPKKSTVNPQQATHPSATFYGLTRMPYLSARHRMTSG